MRGKNKSHRLKLKRSKSHSLKLRKRTKKTKKRGGAGKFNPGLKTIREGNASGVKKRPQAKSPRKPSKALSQVKLSSSPASLSSPAASEYVQHKNFMKTVEKVKKLKNPNYAEIENYSHFDTMAWL